MMTSVNESEKWYSKPKTKSEASSLISSQKTRLILPVKCPEIKSDPLIGYSKKSKRHLNVKSVSSEGTRGKIEINHSTYPQSGSTANKYHTPPSRKRRFGRSPSPTYSPLSPTSAARLKAALESPEFVAKRHSMDIVLEKAKREAAKHPRCKFSRALMTGFECRCCTPFYDAMGLEGEARREYVNKASKHRGWEEAPPTPPRYWDLDIPSKEEQVKLGWVIETDSPLFKKKKKK